MFNGLQDLPAPLPPAPVMTKTPEEVAQLRDRRLALQAGLRLASTRTTLLAGMANMSGVIADFKDLRRLRSVIHAYGLNKAVMTLVNNTKDNGLGKAISLPSNETLDVVGADVNDPRTQETVTGIDTALDTEPAVVAEWVHAAADAVEALIISTEEQVAGFDEAVSHYLISLDNRETTDVDPLAGATLEAVPHDNAMSCIEALITALPKLCTAVCDPTDRDAMDARMTELGELVACLSAHTGLCLDPVNPHQVMQGDMPEGTVPVAAAFCDHGYTVEKTVVLLKKVDELLQAISGLVERKDELVSNLDAAADMVAAIDNDVPPAMDDAISTGEGDEALACGNMTQADAVHCHVSSHLCCLTAVTDAAVRACQGALCVADQVEACCSAKPPVVPATEAPETPPPTE